MPSRQMLQQEAEVQDTLVLMMQDLVYFQGGRWWSRNPTTLAWENDRFYGRRQAMLAQLGHQLYSDPEYQSTKWPDWLTGSQSQYQILGRLRLRVASLPPPSDFPARPDPRA